MPLLSLRFILKFSNLAAGRTIPQEYGPYTVTQLNKGRTVTIAIPQGGGGFKDKQVHVARIKAYINKKNIEPATVGQSREVFDMLEEFEIQQTEEGAVRTGFDMLQRRQGADHKKNGMIEAGMEAWEKVVDDTIRASWNCVRNARRRRNSNSVRGEVTI